MMKDHMMTDRETLLLLSEARTNIAQCHQIITKIARYDPGVARMEMPRLRRLAERQNRLEAKAQTTQTTQDLGFVVTAAIVGGMALLGLGGWVFKHHEETALERYKLESIDKCIEENVSVGMGRPQASQVCGELFSGKDLSDVFKELSRTILIAGVAITGVYFALRWKK